MSWLKKYCQVLFNLKKAIWFHTSLPKSIFNNNVETIKNNAATIQVLKLSFSNTARVKLTTEKKYQRKGSE